MTDVAYVPEQNNTNISNDIFDRVISSAIKNMQHTSNDPAEQLFQNNMVTTDLSDTISEKNIERNESTVNESTVNESTVNESTVSESIVNDSSVNESTVNDSSVNDSSVNESTVNDSSVNELTVNESTVNELTVNDSSVNDSTVNEPTVNESIVNNVATEFLIQLLSKYVQTDLKMNVNDTVTNLAKSKFDNVLNTIGNTLKKTVSTKPSIDVKDMKVQVAICCNQKEINMDRPIEKRNFLELGNVYEGTYDVRCLDNKYNVKYDIYDVEVLFLQKSQSRCNKGKMALLFPYACNNIQILYQDYAYDGVYLSENDFRNNFTIETVKNAVTLFLNDICEKKTLSEYIKEILSKYKYELSDIKFDSMSTVNTTPNITDTLSKSQVDAFKKILCENKLNTNNTLYSSSHSAKIPENATSTNNNALVNYLTIVCELINNGLIKELLAEAPKLLEPIGNLFKAHIMYQYNGAIELETIFNEVVKPLFLTIVNLNAFEKYVKYDEFTVSALLNVSEFYDTNVIRERLKSIGLDEEVANKSCDFTKKTFAFIAEVIKTKLQNKNINIDTDTNTKFTINNLSPTNEINVDANTTFLPFVMEARESAKQYVNDRVKSFSNYASSKVKKFTSSFFTKKEKKQSQYFDDTDEDSIVTYDTIKNDEIEEFTEEYDDYNDDYNDELNDTQYTTNVNQPYRFIPKHENFKKNTKDNCTIESKLKQFINDEYNNSNKKISENNKSNEDLYRTSYAKLNSCPYMFKGYNAYPYSKIDNDGNMTASLPHMDRPKTSHRKINNQNENLYCDYQPHRVYEYKNKNNNKQRNYQPKVISTRSTMPSFGSAQSTPSIPIKSQNNLMNEIEHPVYYVTDNNELYRYYN